MPPATTDITLFDYLRPLWRLKFVTVLVVAAATYCVYAYYEGRPSTYSASSQVYVGSSTLTQVLQGAGTPPSSPRDLANQAQLIARPAIARSVAGRLGNGLTGGQLLQMIAATPDPEADFITIEATAGSPTLAAAIANAFATTYLDDRAAARRAALQEALRLARREYGNTPRTDPVGRKAALEQIANLQSTLQAPPDVGNVSRQAVAPTTPLERSPGRNAVFGGVIALLLCIVAAYQFDRVDRRVRKVEDVESLYDVPVLATVPQVRRPAPVSVDGPEFPGALREPHRTLRVNLSLRSGEHKLRSILFTSAVPEEGKSTIVRNLAFAYAEAGMRVAVVEADLRRPTLAKTFGLVGQRGGLADVLLGTLSAEDALYDVLPHGHNGNGSNGHGANGSASGALHVLTAGSVRVEPTSVLTPERLRPVLEQLTETHDVVLLDSPPLLPVSDTLPLLSLADGTVLVARSGVTTSDAAARLQRTLERVGDVRILGTVVTAVNDSLAYGYEYARHKGAQAVPAKPAAL